MEQKFYCPERLSCVWESKMALDCISVNDSSNSLEMHGEVFIVMLPAFFKLLRIGHFLKNLVNLVLGLQGHCCDIFCQMQAGGLVVKEL